MWELPWPVGLKGWPGRRPVWQRSARCGHWGQTAMEPPTRWWRMSCGRCWWGWGSVVVKKGGGGEGFGGRSVGRRHSGERSPSVASNGGGWCLVPKRKKMVTLTKDAADEEDIGVPADLNGGEGGEGQRLDGPHRWHGGWRRWRIVSRGGGRSVGGGENETSPPARASHFFACCCQQIRPVGALDGWLSREPPRYVLWTTNASINTWSTMTTWSTKLTS
jgi:hypothetical protein